MSQSCSDVMDASATQTWQWWTSHALLDTQ